MDVMPVHAVRRRPSQRRRRLLLALALGLHLVVSLFLAVDGPDRLGGAGGGFDASALLLVPLAGWTAVLALLGTLLPGRGPRRLALALGAVGLVLAMLLVPLYGLGLLLLPGAVAGFCAGLVDD